MSGAAGLCPSCGRVAPTWTPAAILDAIRAWHASSGRAPSAEEWTHSGHSHPSAFVIRKVFGAFPAAVREAGLVPRSEHQANSPAAWTRVDAHRALFQWVYDHKDIPRASDWQVSHTDRPSKTQVVRLFGTWTAFIEAAGYSPRRAHGGPRYCTYCGDPCEGHRRTCVKHHDLVGVDPKFAGERERISNAVGRSALDESRATHGEGGKST